MISNITVDNFKGLRNVSIDLSRLDAFVGENGAGKSSIIQAVSIVKRSLGSMGLNTDLPYANLGSLDRLVPPGETASIMIGGVERLDLKPLNISDIEYSCRLKFGVQGIEEYSCEIGLGRNSNSRVLSTWTRYGVTSIEPKSLNFFDTNFNILPAQQIGQAFQPGGYTTGQGFVKPGPPGARQVRQVVAPGQIDPEKQREAQDAYQAVQRLSQVVTLSIQKFAVVPVIRGFLEPSYQLLPNITPEMNPRGNAVQLGSNVATNLAYFDTRSKALVKEWMKEVMGIDIDWRSALGAVVVVENPENGASYVNEGFGSNQLAFILEEIVRSGRGSTIAIEEPEIHLHPSAQYRLGRLAARVALKEDRQLVLITHSEHIVSGVLTAVSKSEVSPQDVAIWFFEKKDGKSFATRSPIDSQGRTEGGLSTFIQTAINELSDYIQDQK